MSACEIVPNSLHSVCTPCGPPLTGRGREQPGKQPGKTLGPQGLWAALLLLLAAPPSTPARSSRREGLSAGRGPGEPRAISCWSRFPREKWPQSSSARPQPRPVIGRLPGVGLGDSGRKPVLSCFQPSRARRPGAPLLFLYSHPHTHTSDTTRRFCNASWVSAGHLHPGAIQLDVRSSGPAG